MIPEVELNTGRKIPQAGLGTWQIKDPAELTRAFEAAVKAGYRHIDTAQAYGNEHILGQAWKKSGLQRQELFITTKIAVQNFGSKKVKKSFEESLKNLQTDYVDLLLLHFPVTILRKKAWRALEEIHESGSARSIGVSNYTIRHLEEMKDYAKIIPAVNQIETHVFFQQPELIKYCQDNNIVVEAYSPLARAHEMDNSTVKSIADKHGRTYAQIMLRWLIEQDMVVIPKSVTPSRIEENIAVFDFELDGDDMQALAREDKDLRICWSPVHVP